MQSIQQALDTIMSSIYGRDMRQAIYDAVYQMNDNANEAIELAQIKFGTDVISQTSPIGSYIEGTVYFNVQTGQIWKLSGGAWDNVGNMRAIDSIAKTNSVGLTDTYTIYYNDGSTQDYTITNGEKGISITDITKVSSVGNVDNYAVNLSNGATTPNGFSVTNAISIADIALDTTVGKTKNYKVNLTDGTSTPNGFSVTDGTSSYVHIRYSASFDGQNMVSQPTDQTVYIGIVVTTQNSAPTDPALYSWVRFIGKSGSGSGDMLKLDYATKYANVVDRAVALFDGANEIDANQLMTKADYASSTMSGVVKQSAGLVDETSGTAADSAVLVKFSEENGVLKYNGIGALTIPDDATITTGSDGKIKIVDTLKGKIDDSTPKSIISEAYNASVNYVTGQHCIYNNALYKAIGDSVGVTPGTEAAASSWALTDVESEIESINTQIKNIGLGAYAYKMYDTDIAAKPDFTTLPIGTQLNNSLGATVSADGIKVNKTGWYSITLQMVFNNSVANNQITAGIFRETTTSNVTTSNTIALDTRTLLSGENYITMHTFAYMGASATICGKAKHTGAVKLIGQSQYKTYMDVRLIK